MTVVEDGGGLPLLVHFNSDDADAAHFIAQAVQIASGRFLKNPEGIVYDYVRKCFFIQSVLRHRFL